MRSPMFDDDMDSMLVRAACRGVTDWEVTPSWLQWLGYKPLRRKEYDWPRRDWAWEYKEPAELLIE